MIIIIIIIIIIISIYSVQRKGDECCKSHKNNHHI